MHETNLSALSAAEIAAAYNTVYTDYVIPFSMDEARARQHVAAYSIAPEHSILWRDDAGAVVGMAVLGVRGERGWVGGFGIAPGYRGQGLSHRLIEATLDRARQAGLRRVQLEVFTTNPRAIRAYERAGFAHTRDLLILTYAADAPRAAADSAAVWEADPAALLQHAARLGAPTLSWQREPESLESIPDLRGLALGAPESPDAYIVYRATDAAAQIQAIAGVSNEALTDLARSFAARLPGRALSIVNEPEESPACAALVAVGWQEPFRQQEMVCTLA